MKLGKIRTALIALALTAGGTVAVAEPAQAATYSQCHYDYWYTGGVHYKRYVCWIDYSWWEEVNYPWPKDGWLFGSWIRY